MGLRQGFPEHMPCRSSGARESKQDLKPPAAVALLTTHHGKYPQTPPPAASLETPQEHDPPSGPASRFGPEM